jgi:hypothetical protein
MVRVPFALLLLLLLLLLFCSHSWQSFIALRGIPFGNSILAEINVVSYVVD